MIKPRLLLLTLLIALPLPACTKSSAEAEFKYPPGTPADPGSEGKRSLNGVDADGDGVRDDVQRWILATYPNDPAKQDINFKDARYISKQLQGPGSEEWIKYQIRAHMKLYLCYKKTFGEDEGKKAHKRLKAKMLNTRDRTLAYLRSERAAFSVQWPAFTVEDLETKCDD